jgi:pilus assembly protein Flp/PilA
LKAADLVTLVTIQGEFDMINRFLVEEEGQTLVEYGLLVSLIALVVIAVLTLLGRKVQTVFNVAQNSLQTNTN